MKKSIISTSMLSALAVMLLVYACAGSKNSSAPAGSVVTGVAASGGPVAGIVSLKDSSNPAREVRTISSADGTFTLDVAGLTPPFMLKIEWTAGSARQMYSIAVGPGTANINPLSTAAVAVAARVPDLAALYSGSDPVTFGVVAKDVPAAVDSLRAMLSPLLQIYGAAQNPIADPFAANHTGMDALFDNVAMEVTGGRIVVRNKDTGSIIFSAPVTDVPSGTFNPAHMPAGTGATPTPTPMPGPAIDGAAIYTADCSVCHGPLATSSKRGVTAAQIQTGINSNFGGMGQFSTFTSAQIQAIATALSTTVPTPTTPAPADGPMLYATYCSSCHGPLATSSVRGASTTEIQNEIRSNSAMHSLSGLTSSEIQAIAGTL